MSRLINPEWKHAHTKAKKAPRRNVPQVWRDRLHRTMRDTFGTEDYAFVQSLNKQVETRGFMTPKQKGALIGIMKRHDVFERQYRESLVRK